MATVAEVEALALDLPENDRSHLVARLLESLPPALRDEDEGIEEALRRDADFDKNSDGGFSLEKFDERMKQRLR